MGREHSQSAVALAYREGQPAPQVVAKGHGLIAEAIIERLRAWNREERRLAIGLAGSHKIVEARPALEMIANEEGHPLRDAARDALEAMAADR